MRTSNIYQKKCLSPVTLLAVFLLTLGMRPLFGQTPFENKAMAVGDLHNVYTETGGQQEYWRGGDYGMEWPAIEAEVPDGPGHLRADAFWLGAKNVEDASGDTWETRVVHVGPRVTGAGEFIPVFEGFTTTSKFEPPVVTVDGFESFEKLVDNDEVNSDIEPDRIIESNVKTLLGLSVNKRVYAWSNDYHDDYHIQEYIFTNTGDMDDDDDVEVEQTLEDVYIHFQRRYTFSGIVVGSEWGANVMNDIVGDGVNDYGVDFHSMYTWLGNSPGSPFDPLGYPVWDSNWTTTNNPADTSGRLNESAFVGMIHLHADASATDETDDPSMMSMRGYLGADDPLTASNDAFSASQMQNEYDFMSEARGTPFMTPHHAYVVDPPQGGEVPPENFLSPDGAPKLDDAGGMQAAWSYGPYTLEPGENVRIVFAEGVNGLSTKHNVEVGRQWKQAANHVEENADPATPITLNINGTDMTMTKNEWWWTGRDSLFQMFERARAHFNAGLGSIPDPPRPPKTFTVTSGVDRISLEWSAYSGGPNRTGWELYRTRHRYQGAVEDDFQYELIEELPQDATSYEDSDVSRGINYFYYLVAVGEEVTDNVTFATPQDVQLRSSRYYSQTYDPAVLKRPPESLENAQVVPNPFNLGAEQSLRWPDIQDKLAFMDIPGYCRIQIFTELGEHVRTIDHTDGSGDETWDLQTYAGQLVVSGIYFAVIEEMTEGGETTGNQVIRKIIIIR